MNDRFVNTCPYEHFHYEDFFSKQYDHISVLTHRDYEIDLHTHDFYEINVVLSGSGFHQIGNQTIPARKGSVYVIPPGFAHGYRKNGTLDVLHLLLHPKFMEQNEPRLHTLSGYLGLFSIEPSLRAHGYSDQLNLRLEEDQLLELLQWVSLLEEASPDHAGAVQKTGLALYILAMLSRWYDRLGNDTIGKGNNLQYMKLIRSMETIQSEFSNKLYVEDLARACSMSPSYYTQLFRELFRCSPTAYIITQRCRHACLLLQDTNLSMTEIALQCGFYDSSHMVRFFSRQMGMSPREYRKASQNI